MLRKINCAKADPDGVLQVIQLLENIAEPAVAMPETLNRRTVVERVSLLHTIL